MSSAKSPRSVRAAERLAALVAARPEYRAQLLDDWLYLATPGEVRRAPRWVRAMLPARGWWTRDAEI